MTKRMIPADKVLETLNKVASDAYSKEEALLVVHDDLGTLINSAPANPLYPLWKKMILPEDAWTPGNDHTPENFGDLDNMWLSVISMSGYGYWADNGETHTSGAFTFDEMGDSNEPEVTHTIQRQQFPSHVLNFALWVLEQVAAGKFTNPYPIRFARALVCGSDFGTLADYELIDMLVQHTVFGEQRYA